MYHCIATIHYLPVNLLVDGVQSLTIDDELPIENNLSPSVCCPFLLIQYKLFLIFLSSITFNALLYGRTTRNFSISYAFILAPYHCELIKLSISSVLSPSDKPKIPLSFYRTPPPLCTDKYSTTVAFFLDPTTRYITPDMQQSSEHYLKVLLTGPTFKMIKDKYPEHVFPGGVIQFKVLSLKCRKERGFDL